MYKDRKFKHAGLNVHVRRTGPYTVVEVASRGYWGIGVSKKNPIDKENPVLGYRLAFARALRDYADDYEGKIK